YELKEILSLYFNKIGYEVSESEFVNIIHEDSLYVNFGERTPFDLCIGNPPYVRTRELEEEYLRNLRETFKSCEKGNVDIYYAFIERYTNLANELCFITPNSFIKNESAKSLRELIVDKITYLVDFKEKLVFPDARTYTCIFKLGNDISIKECLYANDIDQQVVTTSKKKIFDELDSTSHDMIDNVLSGIATLCDSAYIVKKIDGKFYASTNEETFEIEKDIVVPYLKITKQKNNDFSNIDYMIYPYHGDKSIIDEDTMQTKYAKAYAYLLAVKERLLARDKGKTERYESWYAYGRKQGLHNITENYIIAVPQMIGGACKPQQLDIANLLTEFGKVVFSSGFVIPLRSDNKLVSDYLLSQDFIDFSKKNGKPWPGKDESYYSLTAKQIRKFKV
ncbi:MAG TPA: Eco57I restriction-modification methylase domain-containing protein, partial [Anaerovoracaceae bacterium]|nr:Eco57I restriction-modification methylase domain-containing protein [Anaerovoracaceae bacterium]